MDQAVRGPLIIITTFVNLYGLEGFFIYILLLQILLQNFETHSLFFSEFFIIFEDMWYNFSFNRAIKCFFTFRIDYKCGCLSFGTIWIPSCGSGIRSFGWIIIWILISVLAPSPFREINNRHKKHHHTNHYQSNVPCIRLRLKIFQII